MNDAQRRTCEEYARRVSALHIEDGYIIKAAHLTLLLGDLEQTIARLKRAEPVEAEELAQNIADLSKQLGRIMVYLQCLAAITTKQNITQAVQAGQAQECSLLHCAIKGDIRREKYHGLEDEFI